MLMFDKITNIDSMVDEAVALLRQIVSIESFSGEEEKRSSFICEFLESRGFKTERIANNIIVKSFNAGPDAAVLLLNSHIDTVKPGVGYTFDPFNPPVDTNQVLGLGSNDAGASVISMIETFCYFSSFNLPFNLTLLLSAQEENSGPEGISLALNYCGIVDAAIIGEPTTMKAAIAERGLLVIDGKAKGVTGHAAREEGVNALYIALEDIERLRNFKFEKTSPLMGEVKLTVTQINAGSQHNVVPDLCTFIVDIRPTDLYNNSEITSLLSNIVKSELNPRNLLNRSSATPHGHALLLAVEKLSIESYVSPTTSDWMRLQVPAIKMGPGDSARSHRPDEYVTVSEIRNGIEGYINFIQNLDF